METNIYEREYLLKHTNVPFTGFTNRAPATVLGALAATASHVATSRPATDILSIETNHLKRDMKKNLNEAVPLLEYQLWLEAGKLDKQLFKSDESTTGSAVNISFSSNVWRNFRNSTGLSSMRRMKISEATANLYPIKVPAPSYLGPNTLTKYYEQNKENLFRSNKAFYLAKHKAEKESTMMRYLRLKSELRNPPLDHNIDNNILLMPPKNFRVYPPPAHVLSKPNTVTSAASTSPDMFMTINAQQQQHHARYSNNNNNNNQNINSGSNNNNHNNAHSSNTNHNMSQPSAANMLNMQMNSVSGAAIGVQLKQRRSRPAHGLAVRSSSHLSFKENNTNMSDASVIAKNMNITSVSIFKNLAGTTTGTANDLTSSLLNNNSSSIMQPKKMTVKLSFT